MMRRQVLFMAISLASVFGAWRAKAQMPVMPRSIEQGDTLEGAKYRILYELKYLPDVTDIKRVVTDIVCLDIGANHSKEYSYKYYQADSASVIARKTGQMPRLVQELLTPYVLYKGYPNRGKVTVDYRLPAGGPVMTFQTALPELKWEIASETKTVAGYECMRAITTFAGRDYEAWFAPDLPFKDGPYKFGGLPGLILEIGDIEGHYHYSCIGIYNQDVPIVRWDWKPKSTEEALLNDIVRKLHANPAVGMKALGVRVHFRGDDMMDMPYNPIER